MLTRSKSETRRGLLLSLFVLGLITAIIVLPYKFGVRASAGKAKGLVTRTESADPGLPNYDIRTAKGYDIADFFEAARNSSGKDAVAVADIRDGFVRGEELLRAKVPTVKIEYNDDIRIPEVITPDVWKAKIARLTLPSSEKRSEILRNFVKENNSLVGVTDQQSDELVVTADYTNPDGNLSYAHLEQRPNGIPVFRSEVKAGFTQDGRIIRVINNLAPGLDYNLLSTDFHDPLDAVKAAARSINHDLTPAEVSRNDKASDDLKVVFGTGDAATTAEKMYFPTEPGVAIPAWRVLIWQPVNAYYVIVDAATGKMLWRKNISEDQTQSATYNVYSDGTNLGLSRNSPAPAVPGPVDPTTNFQAALTSRTNVTLIGNEGALSFNNNGWMTDGTNGVNGNTSGNATIAGLDIDGVNGVDAPQNGTGRVFNFAYVPGNVTGGVDGGDDPTGAVFRSGAVTHLFYLTNRYHDALYQRGFTEPARNFQLSNFGRGGAENDRVSAEAQDSSGTNNANFATPADGTSGRMQMYRFTGPTPNRDGDLDADVVFHELTHGTSNRLIGNGSGLTTNRAGSSGEGWGDLFAFLLTVKPADPVNGVYVTGGYATYRFSGLPTFTTNYYHGIRRFPYAPIGFTGGPSNLPHNPLTLADIQTITATNGAYPCSALIGCVGSANEVHNAGEIWAVTGVEVWGRFATRLGSSAGALRTLQVYTDGMKLSPLNPTYIQSRDAVIAAASALPFAPEASLDVQDVREGFRRRGMGFSATDDGTNVVEAFDTANVVMTNPFSVSDSTGNNNGFPEPGENVLLSVAIKNTTGATVSSVTANVNGGANVSYGSIPDGATVTMNIPFTIPAASPCGSSQSVTINVSSALGAQSPQVRSFTLGAPVGGLTQNFDGVVAPALPAGWTTTQDSGTGITWTTTAAGPSSAPNSAFANDPATVNMSSLVSPVIPISSASAQLSFKNKYITESTFDGMVLEIAIGGGAFADILTAGGSFVSNGYNATISANFSSPIAGRQAWSGTSAGGYLDTVVNLPASANGQNVQFRWRMASDVSVAATGVNIDDVQIVSGYTCAAPGGTIAGTVTYGNAIGNPPAPRFISNVTLTGAGSPNVSAVTAGLGATAGQYSLSGFGAGSYIVTPSKTGGINGSITSFDAGRIALHVAGTTILTGNQLVVADVSGNSQVTSFDAGELANYVVANTPIGQTGTWKFTPINRSYAAVTSNVTSQDFTGLLMGEVSGNWANTGARPAKGPEKSTAVTAPSLVAPVSKEVLVPVSVQGVADKGIIAYEFDLRYDPNVIQPTADPIDLIGSVSRGLSYAVNAAEPGLLKVAVYGPMPINSNGILLNLRFTAVGAPGSTSPLTWDRIMFNEGDLGTFVTDGQVVLSTAADQAAE